LAKTLKKRDLFACRMEEQPLVPEAVTSRFVELPLAVGSPTTSELSDTPGVEESLPQLQERFRLLVSSVKGYAIVVLDPQGRVASWNEGAEGIEGYNAQEIIGQHFSRFYTDKDKEKGLPERAPPVQGCSPAYRPARRLPLRLALRRADATMANR